MSGRSDRTVWHGVRPRPRIAERVAALVLMLYAHRLTRTRAARDMLTVTRLDARLLVGTDDHVVGVQRHSAPQSLAQIEHRPGPLFKARIAWEDPTPELPGTNGILVEPAPNGGTTDVGDDASADSLGGDIRGGEARQWHAALARQLAGERLDLDDDIRGEKRTVAGSGTILQSEQTEFKEPLAPSADDLPWDVQLQADWSCCRSPERRATRPWHGSLGNTVPYIFVRYAPAPAVRREREQSGTGSVSAFSPPSRFENAEHGIMELERSQPIISLRIYEYLYLGSGKEKDEFLQTMSGCPIDRVPP